MNNFCVPRHPIGVNKSNGGNYMDTISLILSIIGCLNWGLIGLFQFDLVAWLFGSQSALLSRIVYTLVGLSGIWNITLLTRKMMNVDGE
jgi:uncharacterized membrane protein YuzA (DUF378 family)